MATTIAQPEPAAAMWNDQRITADQASDFARLVPASRADRDTVARNLHGYPPHIKVRGIFFEGLARVVASMKGPDAMATMVARAGVAPKTTAFRAYPHRDFYKLYYLAAPLLHPTAIMPEALRLTARTFFPIFRESMLGRTMSALMGDRPATLLPLLARAYNVSVEGNDHRVELENPNLLYWSCQVEPVDWYADTFTGIVEGAMPSRLTADVSVVERTFVDGMARYRFRIRW